MIKAKRLMYWIDNYQKGKKLSLEKDKPLLLAFVGSDWCPWSQKLEKEILTDPDFIKPLKENFVLVWLEFTEDSLASSSFKGDNWYLKENYNIQELPTLLLLSQEGEVIATFF